MEEYYLRKIAIYQREFSAKIRMCSNEIETLRAEFSRRAEEAEDEAAQKQLESLLAIRDLNGRIRELEAKNIFYKNKLERLEGHHQ